MTTVSARDMPVEAWIERDHALMTKQTARRLLELAGRGDGYRMSRCATLGQVAELRERQLMMSRGFGKAVASDIADSLARAGIGVKWRVGSARPTAECIQRELRAALTVPSRDVLVEEWIRADHALPGRAYGILERLRRVPGPYEYGYQSRRQHSAVCATLGDVADLSRKEVLQLHNSGEKTVRDIADSLGRAGVSVDWKRPAMKATGSLAALRGNLTALAAAWASNANHDPHPGTACAWRAASDALDELLGAG